MTWAIVSVGLSVAGMGMSYMSGKKADKQAHKMIEAQYEADKANYEFNYQEAIDQWEFAKEDLEITKYNLDAQRKYRNEEASRQWIEEDKLRIWDYNEQVKAYNASVESYGVQLEFNDIANELSSQSAKQAYNEELVLLGFQHEDIDLRDKAAERVTKLKRKDLKQQLDQVQGETKINKQKVLDGLAAQRAELNQRLELQAIEGFETAGKVRALNQVGRSSRKNYAAVLAQKQRLNSALIDSMTRMENTAGLDLKALDEKLGSYGDKLDIQNEFILNDLYNTRIETEFAEQQLSESLKSTNLDYEMQQQKRKLDKYSADLKAQEAIRPQPVLPPALPKPLELPEAKLQKPRKPRKGPKPIKGAAVTGHGMAGLASGLSSVSSAVGLYAANN